MTMTDHQRRVVLPTEVRPKGQRRTFRAEFKHETLALRAAGQYSYKFLDNSARDAPAPLESKMSQWTRMDTPPTLPGLPETTHVYRVPALQENGPADRLEVWYSLAVTISGAGVAVEESCIQHQDGTHTHTPERGSAISMLNVATGATLFASVAFEVDPNGGFVLRKKPWHASAGEVAVRTGNRFASGKLVVTAFRKSTPGTLKIWDDRHGFDWQPSGAPAFFEKCEEQRELPSLVLWDPGSSMLGNNRAFFDLGPDVRDAPVDSWANPANPDYT